MKCADHTRIIVALILLAATSSPAQAWDWLTFYPTEVEAVVRFYGTDRRSQNGDDTRDMDLRAGVRLKQEGYSLDRGIARFLLEVEPVYIWGDFESSAFQEDRSGKFLSYLFQLNLLHDTPGPLGLDLSALRTTNLNTGSLGRRYDSEIESRTAALRWKNSAFPMRFIYEQRSLKQDFLTDQTGTAASRRDELLTTWTARGKSSKLDLLLERRSMDDRLPDRDLDFDVDRASLVHRFPWGKESVLRSRFDYFDRTGFNANKRLTIEERARIQHTENVFSQSSYRYFSVTQDIETNEHTGEFKLNHQLYDNLYTSAHLFGNLRQSDQLEETRWRTGLESRYNKQDLFGIGFNAGLGFSYQETDRVSNLGLIEVIDDAHIARLGGAIILNHRFIIMPTIIVTDADGLLVYLEGFDYIAFPVAEDLTQLQTLPGGRIEIGDTVLVSYKARALPSMEFSTTFTNFSLSINLGGWGRLSHYDRKSDDKLLSGVGESFLKDSRDTVTDIEFRWKLADIDTVLGAERRFNRFGGYASTSYNFRQFFTWAATSRTLLSLNITESFTKTDTLNTDLYNLEFSANWQPLTGLSIRPTLGAWKRLDQGSTVRNGSREDQFITVGFTLRWLYRKVSLNLGYHLNRRTTDMRQTNENRLMFNLSRRF